MGSNWENSIRTDARFLVHFGWAGTRIKEEISMMLTERADRILQTAAAEITWRNDIIITSGNLNFSRRGTFENYIIATDRCCDQQPFYLSPNRKDAQC